MNINSINFMGKARFIGHRVQINDIKHQIGNYPTRPKVITLDDGNMKDVVILNGVDADKDYSSEELMKLPKLTNLRQVVEELTSNKTTINANF